MTIRRILPVAAAIALAATLVHAQTSETTPQKQDSHSSGTAPEGMGSTGWTGGTGGSHIGTSNEANGTADGPKQPTDSTQTTGQGGNSQAATPGPLGLEVVTGEDLKGPPTRFPTNKTPE